MSMQNKQKEIQEWMINWIAEETKIAKETIQTDEPFVNFGLGSRQSVIFAAELEDQYGVELNASISWEYPTITDLSEYITNAMRETNIV